eukprot:3742456-Rhodomonas_salina.2
MQHARYQLQHPNAPRAGPEMMHHSLHQFQNPHMRLASDSTSTLGTWSEVSQRNLSSTRPARKLRQSTFNVSLVSSSLEVSDSQQVSDSQC